MNSLRTPDPTPEWWRRLQKASELRVAKKVGIGFVSVMLASLQVAAFSPRSESQETAVSSAEEEPVTAQEAERNEALEKASRRVLEAETTLTHTQAGSLATVDYTLSGTPTTADLEPMLASVFAAFPIGTHTFTLAAHTPGGAAVQLADAMPPKEELTWGERVDGSISIERGTPIANPLGFGD
jgi:hypothetical protein